MGSDCDTHEDSFSKTCMKIILASGIFYPELGGPATYIPPFARALQAKGHEVVVVTYSDGSTSDKDDSWNFPLHRVVRSGKLANYVRYYTQLKAVAVGADVIYAFDHMSAGIPAAFVSRLLGIPLTIRIGGDFIWERYLSRTGKGIGMREYYEQGLHKADGIRFRLIRFVFGSAARLIFTTKFQADVFARWYGFVWEKIAYVANPVPAVPASLTYTKEHNDILWAGRMIHKNNCLALVRAFAKVAKEPYRLVLIGKGEIRPLLEQEIAKLGMEERIVLHDRVPREQLWQMIAKCRGVVFPSLTDISPNTLLDCIAIGTPFVATKEIGYDWLTGVAKQFDPRDVDDMATSIEFLMTDDLVDYTQSLKTLSYTRDFDDAASDTLDIFATL